jgi:hypothetical protein
MIRQSLRALDARESPCITCSARATGCETYETVRGLIESGMLDHSPESKVVARVQAIVAFCGGAVQPLRKDVRDERGIRCEEIGTARVAGADIRLSLHEVGVRNLCGECPPSRKGACATRAEIDAVEDGMRSDGHEVEVWVLDCYPWIAGCDPADGQRLYGIRPRWIGPDVSEPAAK